MEYLGKILEIFGGVTVVALATIGFCKKIIEKYIHTQIEKTANKELEIAKSKLSRSMSAYEILLKKEFEYYQEIDKIYADLVVNIQDIRFYSNETISIDNNNRWERIKECSLIVLNYIMKLKSLNLIYQVYVPMEISKITGEVVIELQNNTILIKSTLASVFNDMKCESDRIDEFVNKVLLSVAMSNSFIRKRVEELSK